MTAATASDNETSAHDLFALSDEQILEIEPEAEVVGQQVSVTPAEQTSLSANGDAGAAAAPPVTGRQSPVTSQQAADQGARAQPGLAVPLEPPAWLAAQMKDPWGGGEAREVLDGVQQGSAEAAGYRGAFSAPG